MIFLIFRPKGTFKIGVRLRSVESPDEQKDLSGFCFMIFFFWKSNLDCPSSLNLVSGPSVSLWDHFPEANHFTAPYLNILSILANRILFKSRESDTSLKQGNLPFLRKSNICQSPGSQRNNTFKWAAQALCSHFQVNQRLPTEKICRLAEVGIRGTPTQFNDKMRNQEILKNPGQFLTP